MNTNMAQRVGYAREYRRLCVCLIIQSGAGVTSKMCSEGIVLRERTDAESEKRESNQINAVHSARYTVDATR